MEYALVNNAFNEAEAVMHRADQCARRAVIFSAGRLRVLSLDINTLRALKRELHQFNAKRGKWEAA